MRQGASKSFIILFHCPPKKSDIITHSRKKKMYAQMTKPSRGCSNYDGSKEGSWMTFFMTDSLILVFIFSFGVAICSCMAIILYMSIFSLKWEPAVHLQPAVKVVFFFLA